jgi:uracil-DNA glycosylase family 4
MPKLEDIHRKILSCQDCPLHLNRKVAVPGEGSASADIVFVGEAPGVQEDLQGRPFVGPAGKLLSDLLASISLRREDVFITNMVKCRPPGNRDPSPGEISSCSRYLDTQIGHIRPKVIVPLGRHALAKWFPKETISKARARPRIIDGITIFPMYHPAAALHNQSLRPTIKEDFHKMAQYLKDTQREPLDNSNAGQQLSMF